MKTNKINIHNQKGYKIKSTFHIINMKNNKRKLSKIFQFNSTSNIIKNYNKLIENNIFFTIKKNTVKIYRYNFDNNISHSSFMKFMNILVIKLNILSRSIFKTYLDKFNLPEDINNLILKYSTLNFNECYLILKELSNYSSTGVLTINSWSESKFSGSPSESESIISGNSGCM